MCVQGPGVQTHMNVSIFVFVYLYLYGVLYLEKYIYVCVHWPGVQTHMFTSLLSSSLITSFAPALKMPFSDIFSSLKLSTFPHSVLASSLNSYM